MYPNLKDQVLATDLDDTLVSNQVEHQKLWTYFGEHRPSLIYITGRYFQSAYQLIQEQQLPQPDILICDAGGSIYCGETLNEDLLWSTAFQKMPLSTIEKIAEDIGIRRQPIEANNRFAFTATSEQYKLFKYALQAQGIDATTIFSNASQLDVLAPNVNKGAALHYVLKKCQHTKNVVVAGDSENDVHLIAAGYPAIIVGNACEELKMLEGPLIYHAQQQAAEGIIEGWHFHRHQYDII